MINPTGGIIRKDSMGDGHYGTSRGAGKTHKGVDYRCKPGQDVLMPVSGRLVRVSRPYSDRSLSGVKIQAKAMDLTMFYFAPDLNLIGKWVNAGEVIGIAQDVSLRYDKHKMFPHIHLQIDHFNPHVLINDFV